MVRGTTTVLILVALALAVAIVGCGKREQVQTPEAPPEPPPATTMTEPTQPGEGETEMAAADTVVKIETSRGDIVAKLFDEEAPITAGNFLLLIDRGFYDGLTIHRVDRGFVIQGGDPNGDGFGGPGFSIPLEVSEGLKHDRGVLSMARADPPDSAGSQFFICLGNAQRVGLLDMHYAVFGKVTEGMDVVDKIQIGDVIKKITIESESPHANDARKAAEQARIR